MFKKLLASLTAAVILGSACLTTVTAVDTSEMTVLNESTFESSTDGWSGRGDATVATSTNFKKSGSKSLFISGRTKIWNGASSSFALTAGQSYYVTSNFLFSNSSYNSQAFEICVQYDLSGSTQYITIAKATVYNGSWSEAAGEITIPTSATNISLYVQTAYTSNPATQDLMDFYLDDVIVYGVKAPEIQDDIKSLKNCFSDYFKVGTALMNSQIGVPANDALVAKHFNSVTFGNELKPDFTLVQSESISNYQQTGDDTNPQVSINNARVLLQYCQDNNLPVRGHCLVWHSQTPDWFFKEGFATNGAWVSKEKMITRMENYIKNLMQLIATEFPDVEFYAWDVVNEAFTDNGTPRTAGSNNTTQGNSAWVQVFGDNSFIEYAFTFARQYAPQGCKLFYNDYNEYIGNKQTAIINLCNNLSAKGILDGIGLQSHLDISYPSVNAYNASLLKYCQTGLEIQITELDITIPSNSTNDLTTQANFYGAIFDNAVALAKQNYNLSAIVFWGLIDTDSWRSTKYPLIFDAEWQAKPAFYEIVDDYSESPSYLLGDVNMDGLVNATDASMVLRFSVGTLELDSTKFLAADVNKSGEVNATDAAIILRYSVGSITQWP